MEINNHSKNVRLPLIDNKGNCGDESPISVSELKANKNHMDGNNLDIIEEDTKNYIDEMKKGSYNILVSNS